MKLSGVELRKRIVSIILFSVLAVVLIACSPPSKVAVVERTLINKNSEAEAIGGRRIRIVEPGDTLHAIAFGSGIDANKLALWNRISDTSKLRVGQRIRLTKPIGFKAPVAKVIKPRAKANTGATSKPIANPSRGAPKPSSQPATNTNNSVVSKPSNNRPIWSWPTQGKVITSFSVASGQQGIDIGGKLGQAVLSAAAGEVVYVGNGLKGYGNLVIVKHSERYLSAYAHNLETFVQEGQKVNSKYRIASLGTDKKRRDALHFQIREFGQPVNPLKYLPSN